MNRWNEGENEKKELVNQDLLARNLGQALQDSSSFRLAQPKMWDHQFSCRTILASTPYISCDSKYPLRGWTDDFGEAP